MLIFRKIRQVQWTVLGVGIIVTALFAAAYIFKPVYFKLLELKLYDTFIRQTYTKPEKPVVAVVDLDEYSIKKFGHWPWPRYRVALLLKKIEMAGALAVGNDILFGEPDGTSPKVLQQVLKRDLQVDVGFTGLPAQLMDNDRLLADVLGTGPYTLGYSFYFQKDDIGQAAKPALPVFKAAVIQGPEAGKPRDYTIRAERVIPPLPEFLNAGINAGYMNTLTDMDGVLRRVPLMISWQGRLYPHLSLATLLSAFKGRIPDPAVKVTRGGIESIKIGNIVVPLEANGSMMVNYKGPSYTFPFIPAAHVLEDRVEKGALENKVVFLGSSAAGLLDIRVSPLAEVYPGVEVNATIVDNILKQDFILRPDWTPGLELAVLLVWGLLTTVVIGWAGAWFSLPLGLILGGTAWYGGLWCLKTYHIWVSPFFPLLALAGNFSILTLFKFWFSEQKKKFYRSAFSKYVSKAVVDQISDSPEKMSLEGEEKEISIMFTDIRSFTTLSEQLTPTQVTNLLHDYFTPVTRSIIQNQGTLDKFIGDAVMCFWNAPLDVKGHQGLAVKTGFEMLDALKTLNLEFKDKYGIQIDIGIGIHTGRCRVGNMGSSDLFDYTIIGDNVNLTSRLEGLTKFYGVRLIISQALKEALDSAYLFQELDQVRVKGKTEPVSIFTVHQPDPGDRDALAEHLDIYDQGLGFYKAGEFSAALDRFNLLCEQSPDTKTFHIYQERCAYFMDNPPKADWDGVFTHKTK